METGKLTKTMKIVLLVGTVLLLGTAVQAQDCKPYFGMSTEAGWGKWPFYAQKWWLKKGAKKYKELCYTQDHEKWNSATHKRGFPH